MTKILAWNDPALAGRNVGQPAAIVGCGPSYDLADRRALDGMAIFALNAAITEFQEHPAVTWCCHDLWKIWRGGFRRRLTKYRSWSVVTRRCYLPGREHEVPYRDVGGGEIRKPFPWRISSDLLRETRRLLWYAELPDQAGYLKAEETVLEVALLTARHAGYSPVFLLGCDMTIALPGRPYGKPWSWKRCYIHGDKFARIRRLLAARRSEWPADVRIVGAAWKGCPFERAELPAPATTEPIS